MKSISQSWNQFAIVAALGSHLLAMEAATAAAKPKPTLAGQTQAVFLQESPMTIDIVGAEQFVIAQEATEPLRIIGIRYVETETGVDIVLISETGTLPLPQAEVIGNALVAEIPNAVLALPDGEDFLALDPANGIALIQATTVNENTVQVSITGTEAPPTAAVSTGPELRMGVALGDSAAPVTASDAIQVVVVADGASGSRYFSPQASTGTRTDTPLRDIPQSIQVIPRAVLEDQQVIRLNDAIRNVSGVLTGSNDPRGQRFIIRGFDDASVLRDGFRLTDGGTGNIGFPELANLEQIEVLKGPASILFGSIEPGGVINLVSKRPTDEPLYNFGLRLGNRSLVEPSIDISGPVGDEGRFGFRLNALYRRENYFRDFTTPVERTFVSPVVTLKIDDRTDLLFELEYRDDTRPSDFGLVADGDRVVDVPFDRALNDRDLEAETEYLRAGYQFEHRFGDNWKVRNAFYYTNFDTKVVVGFGPGFNEDLGVVVSSPLQLDQPTDTFEVQTNFVGEFSTGSVEHTVLAGFDFFRRQDDGTEGRGDLSIINILNVFDPDYDSLVTPDFNETPVVLSSNGNTDIFSFYLQDLISLSAKFKLLAGVRFDTVSAKSFNASFFDPAGADTERNDDAFSPRVGLVYQPIEELSLYTSYSRSFAPNFGTTVAGNTLDPERGEQFELGAKAELLDGRLSATLALFNLKKENVAVADLENPTFSIDAGTQRSRGIEVDVIGEVASGWNLILNYAYTDSEITDDTEGREGNELFGVPKNNFNVWTTYELQQGSLAGLLFGVGVNFVGERFGDLENSFTLDSYVLTNAVISYQRNNWELGLNFRNLFDIDYIESAENNRNTEINPGEGFTVIGSFSIDF